MNTYTRISRYNIVMITPTYTRELKLLRQHKLIAGVDEVGRGPLAGPVVSAVVILDPEKIGKYRSKTKWWGDVRDSKTVSPRRRGSIANFIKENCVDHAIGIASHQEIDELNIHYASLLSMKRAIENLHHVPDMVLIDGKFTLRLSSGQKIKQEAIINGDAQVLSIAAASILAKVYRDDLMKNYADKFPEYGFGQHKGYNTLFHRQSLVRHGPCPIHRMTFEIVQSIMNERFRKILTKTS